MGSEVESIRDRLRELRGALDEAHQKRVKAFNEGDFNVFETAAESERHIIEEKIELWNEIPDAHPKR